MQISMTKNKKILIFANSVNSIINFRYELIKDLKKNNFQITLIAPDFNFENSKKFQNMNIDTINTNLNRTSTNILFEMISIYNLCKLILRLKPNFLLNFSLKPTLYGTICKIFNKKLKVYSMIEGRGYLYLDELDHNIKIKIIRFLLNTILTFVFRFNQKVFFLNDEDKNYFYNKYFFKVSNLLVLPSIGVNLEIFKRTNFNYNISSSTQFIFVGRLLKSKGVIEFINAAQILKKKYNNVTFNIVGGIDVNPNAISRKIINDAVENKIVNWIGEVTDVKFYLNSADIFVLPSYYKEGVPKSILEAMSMSMPIITTRLPGCAETVIEGYNGFFVNPLDQKDLVNKMGKFIQNNDLISVMGKNSRMLAEKKFNVKKINQIFLNYLK